MAQTDVQRVINVGTEVGNPPYTFRSENGTITGFDIDLFNAVSRAAGLRIRYIPMGWTDLLGSLRSRRTDILVASITITPGRARLADFSNPYFRTTTDLAVPRDSTIRSIDDLRGKRVGVQEATITLDQLKRFLGNDYPGIITFRDNTEAFRALRNGTVAAVAADSHVIRYLLRRYPRSGIIAVSDSRFATDLHGFAVRNGDTRLLNQINFGLRRVMNSGQWTRIYRKYFGRTIR